MSKWRVLLLSLAVLAPSLVAFAGTGNIRVYVYDLKTGAGITGYAARIVGSGGTDRTLNSGGSNTVLFQNLSTSETYTLTVSKTDYFDRSIPGIIVSAGQERAFNLGLTPIAGTPSFSISGRVVDAVTNQPIPNASVGGYRTPDGNRYVYATTNSEGQFTIPNCIPGSYVLTASKPAGPGGTRGYFSSPDLTIYAPAAVNDVLLPCAPDGTPIVNFWRIDRFYNTLAGYELRGGECLIQSEAGWTLRANFWEGITLARLPSDLRYTATVNYTHPNDPDQYYPATRTGLTLVEGVYNYSYFYLVPRDAAVGSLTGIVRDMLTGNPVPGAVVTLQYGDRPIYSMLTNQQGRYTFQNLPLGYGGLNVFVSKPGWITYRWWLPALSATANSQDLFIAPNGTPTGALRFYVQDLLNTGYIGGATLRVTLPTGQSTFLDLFGGNGTHYGEFPAWIYYDLTVTAPWSIPARTSGSILRFTTT